MVRKASSIHKGVFEHGVSWVRGCKLEEFWEVWNRRLISLIWVRGAHRSSRMRLLQCWCLFARTYEEDPTNDPYVMPSRAPQNDFPSSYICPVYPLIPESPRSC